jgi:hypothetical protein
MLGVALALALSGCASPGTPAAHTGANTQPSSTPASRPAAEGAATPSSSVATTVPAETPAVTPAQTNPVGLHTPSVGSSERKAIIDALRVPVEKRLKQPVVFKIQHLAVDKGWAFALGQPIQPNGKRIDYKKTPYAQALKDGFFDDSFCALLHLKSGSWKVAIYNIGATDVQWVDWAKTYGAPSAIFPRL